MPSLATRRPQSPRATMSPGPSVRRRRRPTPDATRVRVITDTATPRETSKAAAMTTAGPAVSNARPRTRSRTGVPTQIARSANDPNPVRRGIPARRRAVGGVGAATAGAARAHGLAKVGRRGRACAAKAPRLSRQLANVVVSVVVSVAVSVAPAMLVETLTAARPVSARKRVRAAKAGRVRSRAPAMSRVNPTSRAKGRVRADPVAAVAHRPNRPSRSPFTPSRWLSGPILLSRGLAPMVCPSRTAPSCTNCSPIPDWARVATWKS